jgi:putative tricarboxylic transport membrane protein
VSDIDHAGVILVVGTELVDEAPILDLRVRKAVRRNGAALALVTSLPSTLDPAARSKLRFAPGTGDAALVALAAAILWHIQGFPAMPGQKFGPAWFPGLIAVGLAICGAALVRSGLRENGAWLALPQWTRERRPLVGISAVLAGLVFYVLAADALGFHITGALLLAVWIRLLGASWRTTIVVAVVATVLIHLAFYKLLRVPLPWGVFERWAF